ncbi:MAG: hypothetical protein JSS67_03655 [Bacteroidetes bacterium]|nr:hypothetical protein [Bacteroidota bacterium]
MSAIIIGLGQTRITTYATDGTTPVKRFTLQKEDREGIELRFPKEGATHKLGSGANRAIKRTFFGYRPNLSCRWAVAIDPVHAAGGQLTTTVEVWSGSAWGSAAQINTAAALSAIDDAATKTPVLVEPRLDKAFSFLAQPPDNHVFALIDLKGVVHTKLDLQLEAEETISDLPDWLSL